MYYKQYEQAWATLTAPGAPFEIETVRVRGVPLRAFKNAPPTVRDVWLASRQFADREYLIYDDERLTYGDVHRQSASVANWLRAQGVRQGDRVAIAMRNYPEWMIIYWACVSIGVTVVGVNAWWTSEELDYALKDSRPKVLFCDRERLERALPIADPSCILVAVRCVDETGRARPWADVIATDGDMPDATIDPDEDACIFYTSGTTGSPKGAQLTHRGCVTNLFNMQFAGQCAALAMQSATGAAPPAIVPVGLVTTPLFHVTANNCGAYAATAAGGKMILMYKWDPLEALKLIERERATSAGGVPVMAREIITHPDFEKYDTSSLMQMGGGGAPLPPDLVGGIASSKNNAKPNTGYGMTETCGIITSIGGDFFIGKPTSCGRVMPSYEVRIVDDDGAEVSSGQAGELLVRGAAVIKGYLNKPEATAQSIVDGWLRTGDVARIDEDGYVHIVDRKKDMVLRGGENVYCAEVEACIFHHPAVADCSVFGVPDERLGEEVAAAVVLASGQTLSAGALRTHCLSHISKHKVPRYIWFVTGELPRNANGKVLKRQLRDTLSLADGQ